MRGGHSSSSHKVVGKAALGLSATTNGSSTAHLVTMNGALSSVNTAQKKSIISDIRTSSFINAKGNSTGAFTNSIGGGIMTSSTTTGG